MQSHRRHPKVVIAGGGVAAAEALLALRTQLDGTVALELVTPARHLPHRPSVVGEPFGLIGPPPIDLAELAGAHDVRLHPAALRSIQPARHEIRTDQGDTISYDLLVVATGARWTGAVKHAITFKGEDGVAGVREALDGVIGAPDHRLAFAAPARGWTLPAYELALLSARWLRDAGVVEPRLCVVTAESRPLELFGPEAGDAVEELLGDAGIEVHCGAVAVRAGHGEVLLGDGRTIPADRCIALPVPSGPHIRGVPSDQAGFLPTDAHGELIGAPDVYAAGDVTAFPVKQGGLAAQQADTVAAAIASRLGALRNPAPFRPVLRGLLLTGGSPLYLRSELTWAHGALAQQTVRRLPKRGIVSAGALWWPPAKLAGPHLASWFASGHEALVDQHATARAPDRDRALDLAMLMADVAAEKGDLAGALHALDAAANLSGGVLPAAAAARRDTLRTRLHDR